MIILIFHKPLAFDYTEEDFYGDVQRFWIHGYTGEHGVTGKFKFLTCAIINSDIPQKVLLVSIPVLLDHNMAETVTWCLALVKPLVNSIELTIYDRGFFSKELMLTLTHVEVPYLIFARKNDIIKKEIESLEIGEKKKVQYGFQVNKEKTIFRGETTLAILKQIFDKKSEKSFDWAFATNQQSIDLEYICSYL